MLVVGIVFGIVVGGSVWQSSESIWFATQNFLWGGIRWDQSRSVALGSNFSSFHRNDLLLPSIKDLFVSNLSIFYLS